MFFLLKKDGNENIASWRQDDALMIYELNEEKK